MAFAPSRTTGRSNDMSTHDEIPGLVRLTSRHSVARRSIGSKVSPKERRFGLATNRRLPAGDRPEDATVR